MDWTEQAYSIPKTLHAIRSTPLFSCSPYSLILYTLISFESDKYWKYVGLKELDKFPDACPNTGCKMLVPTGLIALYRCGIPYK